MLLKYIGNTWILCSDLGPIPETSTGGKTFPIQNQSEMQTISAFKNFEVLGDTHSVVPGLKMSVPF